jgi:V/A-type H+-transporting ATPase subunit K
MSPDSLAQVAVAATTSMPLVVAWIGIILMVAMSNVGSAFGTVICGSATIGALKKKDDIFANCMIVTALPGTQGLYGFGAFFLLKTKIVAGMTMMPALAILAAGMIVGVVCLLSALQQARVVACGIESMGEGNDVFSKTLVLAVYPELYAIISFAVAFLIYSAI